jgi:GLPGLI family protein
MLLFGILDSLAQNQGKVFYSVKSKIDIDFGSIKAPPARMERMKNMMNEMSLNQYTLTFNSTGESLYEKPKSEANIDESGHGRRMSMMSALLNQGSSVIYKNNSSKQYLDKRDLYGKAFMVKDSLENFEWEITGETKQIGGYTCIKAKAKTMEYPPFSPKFGPNRSKEKKQLELIESEVVAWFTLDIPVSAGPDKFGGLPGLILELKTNSLTFLCSRIQLTKEEITIEKPKGGKKVNREEYDKLFIKKTKEVEEMMKQRRRQYHKR